MSKQLFTWINAGKIDKIRAIAFCLRENTVSAKFGHSFIRLSGTQIQHYMTLNIGIKHGFRCINVCQVPREMLKTDAIGRGRRPRFSTSPEGPGKR